MRQDGHKPVANFTNFFLKEKIMMYEEFYDRTKAKVTAKEYHYIEESYYEFDGNKDEFCKQWLKDVKSGKWALEYRLRKALDEQKVEYERQLKEKEEKLELYRPYFERARQAELKLNNIANSLDDMVKNIRR